MSALAALTVWLLADGDGAMAFGNAQTVLIAEVFTVDEKSGMEEVCRF